MTLHHIYSTKYFPSISALNHIVHVRTTTLGYIQWVQILAIFMLQWFGGYQYKQIYSL